MEKKKEPKRGKKTLISAIFYVLSSLFMLVFVLVTIYLNDRTGYLDFIRNNVSGLTFLFVCILLVYAILFVYYVFEAKKTFEQVKNSVLTLTVLTLGIIISYFVGRYVSIYARPVTLVALLMLLLRSRREAIFLNIIYTITMFLIDSFTNFNGVGADNTIYASFILSFVAGMIAIFIVNGVKTRIGTLWAGIITTVVIELILILFSASDFADITENEMVWIAIYGAIGGMGSVILFLILLPFGEIIFSCLTSFRLRELTGLDVKLLKRLQSECPGTFNHVTVVAQLAEACAVALDENVELTRAAAYYHDVGKLKNPLCFTENQKGVNIHDELPPEISVNLIRSHTSDGRDLIAEYRLPKYFGEVALRHHGTMPIKFFYSKAMKMTDGEAVIEDYSYQDSKPLDKITAIIMISDACEAATRSLKDRSTDNIEVVVRGIIEERIELDQFSECDITMKELTTIKTAIVNSLSGVYHSRVAYPNVRITRKKV